MNDKTKKALDAWALWYSKKLDRISNGRSREGMSGAEQDLFEALGCKIPEVEKK